MDEPTNSHDKNGGAIETLRFRERAAFGLICVFGAAGLLLIVIAVGHIDAYLATYMVGVACFIASVTMLVGWGAAGGHLRVYQLLDGRVGDVEEVEAAQMRLLLKLVDQIAEYRRRRRIGE